MTLTDQQVEVLRIAFKAAGRHGDAMLCTTALRGGPVGENARRQVAAIAEPILILALADWKVTP